MKVIPIHTVQKDHSIVQECNQFYFDVAPLWNSFLSNNFTAETAGIFTHVVLSSENSNGTILPFQTPRELKEFQCACWFVSSEWPGHENSIVVITCSYNMLINDFQTINQTLSTFYWVAYCFKCLCFCWL